MSQCSILFRAVNLIISDKYLQNTFSAETFDQLLDESERNIMICLWRASTDQSVADAKENICK